MTDFVCLLASALISTLANKTADLNMVEMKKILLLE